MRLLHALPALALCAVAGTACTTTRTVYVYDDAPREPAPAPVQEAAPEAYAPPEAQEDGRVSSVDQFYEPLSPYGRWVYDSTYGDVWVPDAQIVGASYRPYTYGHWAHTEWGWTWADAHPFGWATGHYGQWYYDTGWGWVWVPGTVWSPAWVTWRHGGGHIGWAPIPPGGYYGSAYSVYDTSWVFVSYGAFGSPYISSALIVGPAYNSCFASTVVYRDVYYVHGRPVYRGPDYDTVRRADHRVVHRPIREVDRDRAVMRPPQGTALPRPGSTSRPRPPNDTGRPRQDDRPGDNGSDDGNGTNGRGRRGQGNGNDDSGGGNDDQNYHGENGHGRDGADNPGRGHRDDGDERSARPDSGRGQSGETGRDDDRAGAASAGRGERLQQPGSDDVQDRRRELEARREAPDVRSVRPGQLSPREDMRRDDLRRMDDRNAPSPGRYGAPPSRSTPARRAPVDDGAFQRRDSRPSAPAPLPTARRGGSSRPSVQAPPQQAPQQEQQAPAKKKSDKKTAKKR